MLLTRSAVTPILVATSLTIAGCNSSDDATPAQQGTDLSQQTEFPVASEVPIAVEDTTSPLGQGDSVPQSEPPLSDDNNVIVTTESDTVATGPDTDPVVDTEPVIVAGPVTDTVPAVDTAADTVPSDTTTDTGPIDTAPDTVPSDTTTDTGPIDTAPDTVPGVTTTDTVPGDTATDTAANNTDADPVSVPGTGEIDTDAPVTVPPDADETATTDDSPVENGSPVVDASATGADFSGGDDDSPTTTETLSLVGPFVQDRSRGAGPPSAPTGLVPLMAAEDWIEFSWVPSEDDQSVEAYEIYRDGVLIGTVRGDTGYEHDYRSWLSTSFIDCNYTRYANCVDDGLQPQPGASYEYSVVAVDNEGMQSEPSEAVVMSMATPSQSTVDLSDFNLVFTEEFDGTTLDRGRWKTSLPWGPDQIINQEQQYFVNLFGSSNPVDYDPFVFTGDTLQITGIPTPVDQLEAANGQPYLSGVLTTADVFEMTYGYVEMRAKFASGDGMLSTFYLFNQNFYKNKPEIDIAEYIGARPDKVYQTYHYYDSNRARTSSGEKHSSPTMETTANQNLSDDFHTYSVLWEPELVIWYIDGVEVRRLEGVRVSDEPMNIVTQLVMGSVWIGDPDPASVPAVMEIDYIRAYQR